MPKAVKPSTTPTRRAKRTTRVRPTETDPFRQTIDDVAVLGYLWPNDQWIAMNMRSSGRYLGTMCFSRNGAMKLATTVIAVCSHFDGDQFTEEELACIEQVAASARRAATRKPSRKNGAAVTEMTTATG